MHAFLLKLKPNCLKPKLLSFLIIINDCCDKLENFYFIYKSLVQYVKSICLKLSYKFHKHENLSKLPTVMSLSTKVTRYKSLLQFRCFEARSYSCFYFENKICFKVILIYGIIYRTQF